MRSRLSGRTNRLYANAPITMPVGVADMSSPTMNGLSPNVLAYGAASPSGST